MTTDPIPPGSLTPIRFSRLLLTGAAGGLGHVLRPRLKAYCQTLRVSDRVDLGPAAPDEELVPAALEDRAAVLALLEDVDAVVHLGGISVEAAFDPILQANIAGVFNLYEAARRQGVRRVVLASSNHVTGFYRQDERIDARDPVRPDTLYGVSKVFGENLARMFHDRHGVETVCLRIGSCLPEPIDRRTLASWLSYNDLERLVVASLTAPLVGHCVVYGVSDNPITWWHNPGAATIGYRPQDSSERFRAGLEARQPQPDLEDPVSVYQGGAFVRLGPFD